MSKINDTTDYPVTVPAAGDMLIGTDVSNTSTDAGGETANFSLAGVKDFVLAGVMASPAELSILQGVTATADELNFVDGVTSDIQTQIDDKAPLASPSLTGSPTAPTPDAGTRTKQIATTEFVDVAVARFPTFATISAADNLISGATYTVTAGYNGQPETFKFVSDSTITADGALVLTSAMATGRLVSARRTFATLADMLTDRRGYTVFTAGEFFEAAGYKYQVKLVDEARPDFTTAGGVKLRSFDLGTVPNSLIAHRGFVNVNLQNTMFAFAEALKITNDLECDVQISDDNTAYVFHDTTVDALTSGTGTFTALSDATIDGLTFDALAGTDLSSLVAIPTFAEFLGFVRQRDAFFWAEIKNPRTAADVDIISQLILDEFMASRGVIQTSFIVYTERVLNYDSSLLCGYINGNSDIIAMQGFINTLAKYPDRGWLLTTHASVTANPSIVEYARVRRVGLAVWTVNSQEDASALLALGVRQIMSDLPLTLGSAQ